MYREFQLRMHFIGMHYFQPGQEYNLVRYKLPCITQSISMEERDGEPSWNFLG